MFRVVDRRQASEQLEQDNTKRENVRSCRKLKRLLVFRVEIAGRANSKTTRHRCILVDVTRQADVTQPCGGGINRGGIEEDIGAFDVTVHNARFDTLDRGMKILQSPSNGRSDACSRLGRELLVTIASEHVAQGTTVHTRIHETKRHSGPEGKREKRNEVFVPTGRKHMKFSLELNATLRRLRVKLLDGNIVPSPRPSEHVPKTAAAYDVCRAEPVSGHFELRVCNEPRIIIDGRRCRGRRNLELSYACSQGLHLGSLCYDDAGTRLVVSRAAGPSVRAGA
jgi:hypothetical protein